MNKLIYTATCSLDGYVEDEAGSIEWTGPSDEVFAFITEKERPISLYLYGRRMYETMLYWQTIDMSSQSPLHQEYTKLWRAARKIVYSTSLESPSSDETRIEHTFDPDAIRQIKATEATDVSIGGATLAAQAFAAGLVDEIRLFVLPVIIGGGKRALPSKVKVGLELEDERRFASGVVYLNYRVGNTP